MWWILYGYYVMFMCGDQNSWFCKAWEKSGSQVIAKNVSWPMRFQYSLIVNISLID